VGIRNENAFAASGDMSYALGCDLLKYGTGEKEECAVLALEEG
jgi:hypothetical protein